MIEINKKNNIKRSKKFSIEINNCTKERKKMIASAFIFQN
jgi:hypothetical protein